MSVELPRHLDREGFEQIVAESTTVFDVARSARMDRMDAKRLARRYGLDDQIQTVMGQAGSGAEMVKLSELDY